MADERTDWGCSRARGHRSEVREGSPEEVMRGVRLEGGRGGKAICAGETANVKHGT